MTVNSMNFAELQQLLEADWLDDESKEILKKTIVRTIKLLPKMIDILEEQLNEED